METVAERYATTIHSLARAGDWLTGIERVDAWREARKAQFDPLDAARKAALSPAAVSGSHGASAHLQAIEVEVVHRVATDPGRLTQPWANEAISVIGEERYTELVGVTATSRSLDRFDVAMGRPLTDLPEPVQGEPARHRPDTVGEVGAWVSQTVAPTRANVSRALSLVPVTDKAWRALVDTCYSHGAGFNDFSWDRPLSRPQTELIAARTTVVNECFY